MFGYELLIILGVLLLNGLFAMAEMAVVSARRARLREMANAGHRGAAAALALSQSPERFLSTVQVGITLVGMFAGAYGGATIAEKLALWFGTFQLLAPYAEPLALAIVVLGISYVSLVLGELAPKRIALSQPEAIASVLAAPMRLLAIAVSPLVWVLSLSTRLVLLVFRIRTPAGPPVTEEELRILLREGQEAGVFEKAEHEIVERVFRLSDRRISSLMTPRTELVWIDIAAPIGDSMRTMIHAGHTHYPVCRGDIEKVVGVTSVKKQLARMVDRQPPDLLADLEPPYFVPEAAPAFKVLEQFRQSQRRHALTIDEYGGISGMVTLNDIMKAVVGEAAAAMEESDPPAVQRADGSWLLSAWLPLGEVMHLLGVAQPAGDERPTYDTLAGLILDELGHIPRVADTLTWDGYLLEVVDMDGKRIDKVLARRAAPPPLTSDEKAE